MDSRKIEAAKTTMARGEKATIQPAFVADVNSSEKACSK
jgi:hypothetical protein